MQYDGFQSTMTVRISVGVQRVGIGLQSPTSLGVDPVSVTGQQEYARRLEPTACSKPDRDRLADIQFAKIALPIPIAKVNAVTLRELFSELRQFEIDFIQATGEGVLQFDLAT